MDSYITHSTISDPKKAVQQIKTTNFERPLGGIESSWSNFYDIAPINAVTTLKVEGPLTENLLRIVLDRLQARHPLAQVRIVKQKGNLFLTNKNVGKIPLQSYIVKDFAAYKKIIGYEYDTPFDYEKGPLLRACLVKLENEPNSQYIVLNYMHTIGDGESVMNLSYEIMDMCREIVLGNADFRLKALEAAPVAEKNFPARIKTWRMKWNFLKFLGRQLKDQYWYRHKMIFNSRKLKHSQLRTGSLEKALPKTDLKKALAGAKANGANMHGAACAALLCAEYEYYCKKYKTEKSIYLKCSSVVNLRTFLDAPISSEHYGSYVSMVASSHQIKQRVDFWQLARDIKTELVAGLKRDDHFCVSMYAKPLSKLVVKLDLAVISALSVSNVGRMKFGSDFGPFQLTEYIGNVSNLGGGSNLSVVLNTFAGTMYWSYTYAKPLISDEEVDGIASRAIEILLEQSE